MILSRDGIYNHIRFSDITHFLIYIDPFFPNYRIATHISVMLQRGMFETK